MVLLATEPVPFLGLSTGAAQPRKYHRISECYVVGPLCPKSLIDS